MADPSSIGQGGIVGGVVALLTAVAYKLVDNYRTAGTTPPPPSGDEGQRVSDLKDRVAALEKDLDEEREGRQRDRRDFEERLDRMRREYDERIEKLQERLYEEISRRNARPDTA